MTYTGTSMALAISETRCGVRRLPVRGDVGEGLVDGIGVGRERLQRLQVHVEAEDRGFIRRLAEPERAQQLTRGLTRVIDARRKPHAAADVEQQRDPYGRIVVRPEIHDVTPRALLLDDEVLFPKAARESSVAIAHDGGDGNEINRRSEGRLCLRGGGLLKRDGWRAHQ